MRRSARPSRASVKPPVPSALQGEGVIQEVKGKGQKAVGDAKEATKDAVNKAAAADEQESLIERVI